MKKKVIWIVVALLVIVVAVLGILYYTTDLFKTPEQLFYRHFADSSNLLGETSHENFMTELKAKLEASMEVEGEITAKITSNDTDLEELATAIGKGKITYNTKTVGSEQKMQNDITLNYNGKNIVTLNILKNKEQYGLKVTEAYDKYISVENNNLKALFEKLGMDSTEIPDKIEMVDYYELLNVDKETLKHIETTYSNVIKQNIPEECYSVEKDVTVDTNAGEITTNAYKLALTDDQLKTVLIKVLETLKNDDTTLDLIVAKYNTIVESYEYMGEVDTLTKEELVNDIEDDLTELNKEIDSINGKIEIVVYAAKDNKAKVEIIVSEKEVQEAKYEFEVIKEEDTNIIVSCSDEDGTIDMVMSYSDTKAEVVVMVESDGTIIEVNVKEEVKSRENVTVEDFNSDNSVKLNDMTEEEITELLQTIYNNVLNVLPQKMQLLGINTLGPSNTL